MALTATVLYTNRSGMADRLATIEFKKVEHNAKQVKVEMGAADP